MDPNVYVISLDAVDLSLLPITPKRNDKVVPLWSRSNLDVRNDEFYEFKIKTKEDIKLEDQKTSAIVYAVCDICDIDVPKVYLSEHKNSFKHKFNKKIADVALKRLQLHMNRQDEESENDERDPSKCYCPECSIVIDCKDEIAHKKSIAHKQAVLLERFLSDFLQFYTNDDKVIEKQDTISELGIKNDATNNTTKNEKLAIATERKLNKVTKIEPLDSPSNTEVENIESIQANKDRYSIVKKSVLSTDTHVKKDNIMQDNTKNNKMPIIAKVNKEVVTKQPPNKTNIAIDEYLDLLTRKFNISPMSFKEIDGEVEIKTIDGSKVRVSEDNFYGLDWTLRGFLYCIVCECVLLLEARENHLLSDQHMEIMSLPLEDKNCIRRIRYDLCHCIICNATSYNSFHYCYHPDDHLKNSENSLISDKANEQKRNKKGTKSKQYFCDVCQVKVPNNENNIAMHLNGKSHKRKLGT